MKQARADLWAFMETCERVADVAELERSFLCQLEKLGFAFGGLLSHVENPVERPPDAVWFYRAPIAWVEQYLACGFHRINPLHSAARGRVTPFYWDDPAFRSRLTHVQKNYMCEMEGAGVAHGVTIPIRSPGAPPATCSLVPGADGVPEHHFLLGHSMAVFTHERARRLLRAAAPAPCEPLTERERVCLILAARGKSDWTISELLGVSEGAVHKCIERAKRKFGVATRVQAVVCAINTGSVMLGDAVE